MGKDHMIDLFNWEAEEKIIGYLFNPQIPKEKKYQIVQLLTPDYFTEPKARSIFGIMKSENVFDKIILYEKASTEKKALRLCATDVMDIDDFVTTEEAESYIEIISDKFQKRKIYDFGKKVQQQMLEGGDQFQVALEAQSVLSSMGSKRKLETNQELLEEVLSEKSGDVLKTGFKHIDKFLGGYARGMLITIAGDSGHMKTTLALEKSFRIAEANPNIKVGIFSKEMLATDLMKKQISRICGIPINKIFSQDYDKNYVREKMMEVEPWASNRIRIINPNSFSGVADIARIQMTYRFDVWFLDFIQMLEFAKTAQNSSDYNIQIGQNMRNLQALALATRSVGIILSQVKKGIEFRKAKKPTVSDIEWSGLIKQLSSYIFFSYYPGKYYGFDVLPPDYYYLIAEKTRFAEQFTYPLKVNPTYGYFDEIESADERQKRVNELRSIVD
jgi:replicative DNA helicase